MIIQILNSSEKYPILQVLHPINGLEAVKLFEKHKEIDHVLIDFRISAIDGIEQLCQ